MTANLGYIHVYDAEGTWLCQFYDKAGAKAWVKKDEARANYELTTRRPALPDNPNVQRRVTAPPISDTARAVDQGMNAALQAVKEAAK